MQSETLYSIPILTSNILAVNYFNIQIIHHTSNSYIRLQKSGKVKKPIKILKSNAKNQYKCKKVTVGGQALG
jgi:hypothetical protein